MKHLYLFTLEIVPLKVGETYDDLPSHLTLMSRFISDISPEALSDTVSKIFADTAPVVLNFGETIELGPKKVTAHMVKSPDEEALHMRLQDALKQHGVAFQYPEFIGANHKAHVTKRDGVVFEMGSQRVAAAAYLVEVIDGQRAVRTRFELAR